MNMPRVCRAETEKNRNAIRQASARLFREQGLRASVTDVMKAVGLTHGGFYGHFGCKDELAAEACATAFAESVARWSKRVAGAPGRRSAHAALIEGYLSPRNRSAVGGGCPIAALATDVAREPADKPVRRTFRAGLERLVAMLADVEPGRGADAARTQALTELATLVGAMVLARATEDHPLSDEFMTAARQSLLAGRPSARRRAKVRRPRRPHAR
jgi:TetR/AcrR family transcriptional regulator, transcriptional repressor for nem operon